MNTIPPPTKFDLAIDLAAWFEDVLPYGSVAAARALARRCHAAEAERDRLRAVIADAADELSKVADGWWAKSVSDQAVMGGINSVLADLAAVAQASRDAAKEKA
jgi:hypothetical protein